MSNLYALSRPVQKIDNGKIDADSNSRAFERFNTAVVLQLIESRRKMIALSR
jgi:hypothetical protein